MSAAEKGITHVCLPNGALKCLLSMSRPRSSAWRPKWKAKEAAIRYAVASALALPFAPGQFDFATAVMSLMDLPDHGLALKEIHRVVRAGGLLQFSIMHPCFFPPHRQLLRTPQGKAFAVEVGQY